MGIVQLFYWWVVLTRGGCFDTWGLLSCSIGGLARGGCFDTWGLFSCSNGGLYDRWGQRCHLIGHRS